MGYLVTLMATSGQEKTISKFTIKANHFLQYFNYILCALYCCDYVFKDNLGMLNDMYFVIE